MVQGILTQGTTPSFDFSLPIPADFIKEVRLSFSQKGKMIICKTLQDCVLNEKLKVISTQLHQEDTYLFKESEGLITIEMRVLTQDDKVYSANDLLLRVEETADKVVME